MSDWGPYEGACGSNGCDGRVCLTEAQHKATREAKADFYCSRGHRLSWTGQPTYRQLQSRLSSAEANLADAHWRLEAAERSAVVLATEFATCPFETCDRWGYRYANQRTLIAHLDRAHGTDLGARVSWDLVDAEAAS